MLPTREQAEKLLTDAEESNPGLWANHSRVAAHCAKSIAAYCENMDENKAYILGLLHDIGRKYGTRHLGHVSDGYSYMMSLGYDEVAKVCLTHSFCNNSTQGYIGKFDTSKEETDLINNALATVCIDDYDRLIQLCDCLAGTEGVLDIEIRMADIKQRYGSYPQEKWDSNLELKRYFEAKTKKSIYDVVNKDNYQL